MASNNRITQIDMGRILSGALLEPKNDDRYSSDTSVTANNIRKRPRLAPIETTQATDLRLLKLPQAVESGKRAHECINVQKTSPWKRYMKIHQLRFGDNIFTVSESYERSDRLIIMKKLKESDFDSQITMTKKIQSADISDMINYREV